MEQTKTKEKNREIDMLNGKIAGKLIMFGIGWQADPFFTAACIQQHFTAIIQLRRCRCCRQICRKQCTCSSWKQCRSGRNICKSDHRTFRGTECSFGKSDRSEQTGTDQCYAAYDSDVWHNPRTWAYDPRLCLCPDHSGIIRYSVRCSCRSTVIYPHLFLKHSVYDRL